MSCAARMFNSKSDQTLYSRITPSKDQFATQQARWNDLADILKSRLKEDTDYPTSTWLQGSYKFDTQIRPWQASAEFDIDLGLYFEWTGPDADGDYDPEGFKQLVQNALLDYADDDDNDATGVAEPKERCCRISFKPDFHIDVPCYHLDREADRRALATETKGWEDSDPKAIYNWFKELFDEAGDRAQLRRLVCYMKMWAALKIDEASRPSSIMLTVLVAEAMHELDRSVVSEDDDVLERVVTAIADRLDGDAGVPNPADPSENLNRLEANATAALRLRLRELEETARRANAATAEATAAEIWTEAFEHFFPMPEDLDEEEGEAASTAARAGYGQGHGIDGVCLRPADPRQCRLAGQCKLRKGKCELAAHHREELLHTLRADQCESAAGRLRGALDGSQPRPRGLEQKRHWPLFRRRLRLRRALSLQRQPRNGFDGLSVWPDYRSAPD